MKPQSIIFVGILISIAQSKSSCPCFSDRALEYFNIDNTSNDSCNEDPVLDSLYIWEIQDSDIWHPHGYGIDVNYLQCLQEGDMIRTVSQKEADTCMDILLARCKLLITIQEEKPPISQIELPISTAQSCPCFSKNTLNSITNEKISDDSCIESPDRLGNLYIWEKENMNTWYPYGIGVEMPYLSCFEGHTLRDITKQESELCLTLLRGRCEGFLQEENQNGPVSSLSVLARSISMIFRHS